MKGADRLLKIQALLKAGKISRETAIDRLISGKGKLNRAAYNLAVEEGLCLVCIKWDRCIVKDCTIYTCKSGKRKGICTWFEEKGGKP